ncbi:MAG: Fe-S cluster assembly protein SufB [Candidatus Aenigmarchaeota archaeon]|nr:Fe-S cluster assembly protein SufB [Candidatus Aenigmarchaeota archaeon]
MNKNQQGILQINADYATKYGFNVPENYVFKSRKGLSREIVEKISEMKNEPKWMTDFRLRSLDIFMKKSMPKWGANLDTINFDDIYYYLKPTEEKAKSWEDLPEEIKNTFDRLGIPEAERKFLGGVGAQYESENLYHSIREDLAKKGVIFLGMDDGLKEYPEIVKKYFGTIVPPEDNKFAALNSAVWSGGSFVLVPKGVKVDVPLQAYFRINAANMGQFERTLIIAEENSFVHYTEGCFTKGTPIKTISGLKNIEDIKEGDIVLTHTNSYKKVYKIQKRKHDGVMCTINYFGDTRHEIKITGDHPILSVRRTKTEYKNNEWETEWVESKNLEKGDYVAIPIDRTIISQDGRFFSVKLSRGRHTPKVIEFKIDTDKDFFRLVGYYMAEGSIIKENYLTFTFNKNEKAFIEDVKELLEKFFGKAPLENEEYKNGISLVLCSTLAARLFKQEFGSGAKNKSLPKWFMLEAPEKQVEFIKAYWRGDGSFINKKYSWGKKRMFRINTISEVLAEQTRDLLLRLNIFASINVWNKKEPRSNSFAIYIGGSHLHNFADIVSHNINGSANNAGKLLLKQELMSYTQITDKYAFVPIKDIKREIVKNVEVYNFSVEDDESYIAHGIAVHNCTAPVYTTDSLHSAVVEIIALPGSRVRYTTIQNWSPNVYNLVTKRAYAYENATVEWVDCNIGSKITSKYPSVFLVGKGAKGEILSIAFAGKGQHQDAGGKAVHLAPNTQSTITSKSISKDGGRTTYRGLLKVYPGCKNVKSNVRCDALILDDKSASDTIPYMEINEKDVSIGHEASVGKISDEQLFYLMSRGLNEAEAMAMIVRGFIEPISKELPMEFALELNRLIELEMEGSVG